MLENVWISATPGCLDSLVYRYVGTMEERERWRERDS